MATKVGTRPSNKNRSQSPPAVICADRKDGERNYGGEEGGAPAWDGSEMRTTRRKHSAPVCLKPENEGNMGIMSAADSSQLGRNEGDKLRQGSYPRPNDQPGTRPISTQRNAQDHDGNTEISKSKISKTIPRSLTLSQVPGQDSQRLESPTKINSLLELSLAPMTVSSQMDTSRLHESPDLKPKTSENDTDSTISPIKSPPYWQVHEESERPQRSTSWTSTDSVNFAGITLCDNEIDARNAACWAKGVTIRGFTIVNGTSSIPSAIRPAFARVGGSRPTSRSGRGVVHAGTADGVDQGAEAQGWGYNMRASLGMGGIGAFVVYNVAIETLDGGSFEIKRRYSEFDTLRVRLAQAFPRFEKAMPEIPPKSVVSRFRPKFLEHRRRGLEYFLGCVLLNPEFAGSPITKEFLFA